MMPWSPSTHTGRFPLWRELRNLQNRWILKGQLSSADQSFQTMLICNISYPRPCWFLQRTAPRLRSEERVMRVKGTALGILLYWKYLSVFSIDFFTLFPIAIAVQLPLFVRHGDHEGKGWKMKINYIWPSRLTLDKLDQMWKHWFLATGRSWSAGGPLQQMINPANDRWMNIKGKNKKKWTGKT